MNASVSKRRRSQQPSESDENYPMLFNKFGGSMHNTSTSFAAVVQMFRRSEVHATDVEFARRAARLIANYFESAHAAVTAMKTTLSANPGCLSTVLPFLVDEISTMMSTHADDVLATCATAAVDSESELAEVFRHAMCHLVNVGNWLQAAGSLKARPFSC